MEEQEKKIISAKELLRQIFASYGSSVREQGKIIISNMIIQEPFFLRYDNNEEWGFPTQSKNEKCEDGKYRTRVEYKLEFVNCIFEKRVHLTNLLFKEGLTFNNCKLNGVFEIIDVVIKDHFLLEDVEIKSALHLDKNQIEWILGLGILAKDIRLLRNDIKSAVIYDPTSIETLNILFHKNHEQNIFLTRIIVEKLIIGGRNTKGELSITDSLVNHLLIENFENENNVHFIRTRPETQIESSFHIIQSDMGKAHFHQLSLEKYETVSMYNNDFLESAFIGTIWPQTISAYAPKETTEFKIQQKSIKENKQRYLHAQKETYRQLKYIMDKQGDRLNEVMFYEREMNIHNKLLPWSWPWKDTFWDKIILHASRMFSRYGQSILRPLFWLLAFNGIFFFVLAYWHQFKGIAIEFTGTYIPGSFTEGLGQFFALLNPTRKIDESLTGWAIFWDLISRVSAGFFLYNMIRATRRFVK